MKQVYIVSSDVLGLIYIGTSKRKIYDFLRESENLTPTKATNYISFSQWCKWNNPAIVEVVSGSVKVQRFHINQSLLGSSNLFF